PPSKGSDAPAGSRVATNRPAAFRAGPTLEGRLSRPGQVGPRRRILRRPQPMSATPGAATIAAVLAPDERVRVEAAGSGCFAVLTRDSIPDAIRLVRERAVDALLLSVSRCGPDQAPALARLVEACPGLPTVALLSGHSEGDTE